MKRKILYILITAVIGAAAFSIGKNCTVEPAQPKTPELMEMTVENGGLYLEYSDGNNFYSYWISTEKLVDNGLINIHEIKGWEYWLEPDITGIELQASNWTYTIEKEPYTVNTIAWRTE